MGDGRYYTPNQFFTIITLTILIIFSVISLMLCVYKWQNKKSSQFIQLAMAFIIAIAFFRYTSAVIVSPTQSTRYLQLSNLFFIILNVLIFFFVFYIFKEHLLTSPLIIVAIGYVTLFLVYIIFRLYKTNVSYLFYSLLFLYLIGLNYITNYFIPYRITSSAFNDIKDLILDYVFITDAKGTLMYQNAKSLKLSVFKSVLKINPEQIHELFESTITMRNSYEKLYIKTEDSLYFQYNQKEILDNDQCVGHIYTFIDVTILIQRLDQLKSQEEKTYKINKQLMHYKSIVYELEKEKEINTLLSEIAINQTQAMSQLMVAIVKLQQASNDDFYKDISKIILNAQSNLQDVRKAVTAYIHYYDQ